LLRRRSIVLDGTDPLRRLSLLLDAAVASLLRRRSFVLGTECERTALSCSKNE
jgi:hypothetical protein